MHSPDSIHAVEPTTFRAGDSVKWNLTLADYPASIWTLQYVLINAYAKHVFSAAADGDDYAVRIAPADSAKYAAGVYAWHASVTDGTDRYTIRAGAMTVSPDFSNPDITDLDTRSHAVKMLAAIEAVIEGRASDAEASYSIGGRSIQFYSPTELYDLKKKYAGDVARERAAARRKAGKKSLNNVRVRL